MPLTAKQQKQFDAVCERIAEGVSLRSVCSKQGMPSRIAVRQWMNDDESGAALIQYAQAREEQAEFHAGNLLAIADDSELDPADRRVKIDTRKWIASKLKPGTYGEKQEHKHTGQVSIIYSAEDAKA